MTMAGAVVVVERDDGQEIDLELVNLYADVHDIVNKALRTMFPQVKRHAGQYAPDDLLSKHRSMAHVLNPVAATRGGVDGVCTALSDDVLPGVQCEEMTVKHAFWNIMRNPPSVTPGLYIFIEFVMEQRKDAPMAVHRDVADPRLERIMQELAPRVQYDPSIKNVKRTIIPYELPGDTPPSRTTIRKALAKVHDRHPELKTTWSVVETAGKRFLILTYT